MKKSGHLSPSEFEKRSGFQALPGNGAGVLRQNPGGKNMQIALRRPPGLQVAWPDLIQLGFFSWQSPHLLGFSLKPAK